LSKTIIKNQDSVMQRANKLLYGSEIV